MLDVLKGIGRRLMKELKELPAESQGAVRGASGDWTHPIDKKAEDIILSGLEAAGEPLSVISEEAGLIEFGGGGKTVLIDPIDGSRNALAGIPFYCSSIAVAGGESIEDIGLSYVINLSNGDEFWAERGRGAYKNGRRIYAQKDDALYMAAYEAQSPGKDISEILPLLKGSRKARCFGSTALALAYLSASAISVFVSPSPSRSFDFGGGWLLVKESGGLFTDIEGRDIGGVKLGLKRASTLLASGNGPLHAKALRLLGR